ncbi:MAG TPA: glycoside hydrolase family 2 TIM barrel-domain containing protein [Opitutaceae bacterium]|nr:glycoside hydrolase family 2 TIM barrel-domain containing protein [Opitutaceae bacterium]
MRSTNTTRRTHASICALLLSLVLSACTSVPALAGDTSPLRETLNFNREWSFQLGDHPGAEAATFDDAKWEHVGLPHSFSTPYFAATNSFYVGFGWYRKTFDVPAAWQGKRLFLHFDGAFQDAEIFVNGRKVGAHQGGYTGFEIEITDAAVSGRNLVAVRLNNRWNPRLAPRAGEHQFSGGIYRNVWLVATDPLHVAWYGTAVTTPQVSTTEGTVNVKTEVVNQSPAPKDCTVRTEVLDPAGRVVSTMSSSQRLAPGVTAVFDQTSAAIARPQLWSPEQPTLYSVKTTVLDGERPADDFVSPLGFRWFEFTADRGFFLNGEHRYFRGANVHQDHAGWGDAVPNNGFHRDVQLIKNAGFDFIRGSHYPHAPAFSAACDRIGVLFWSENCFWGTGGADNAWGGSAYPTDSADEAEFEASVRASLRDMIRIHRNHPSIVVWSMSNEPFFSDPKVMPQVRRFLRELVAYSHELDPTRPAAIGGAQRGEIDKLGDIAGYNGDGARLFPNPGIANVVSEYGSMMVDRPGLHEPGFGDLPLTPGADQNQPYGWRLPWRSGEVIWCGFDHGSIAGRTFGGMGMLDYFRLPKRQWYWYRNEHRGIPAPTWPQPGKATALRLTADKTTLRAVDGTDDAHLTVTVVDKDGTPLSNCPTVTLTIESGPGEFPTGPSITFAADSDIPIRDGAAAIEFHCYHAGETFIRATSPGLADATLRLTSLGEPRFVPGVTPAAAPRPYRRFSDAPTSGRWHKFGLENPTRASSETPGNTGRHGNDGSFLTSWLAAPGDTAPWLRIDLERVVSVSALRILFPATGLWRYRIEISPDGERDWRTFAEEKTDAANQWTTYTVEGAPLSGRYVRITLLSWPAGTTPGLGDVSVTGTINSN